jgi:hypothetical protein
MWTEAARDASLIAETILDPRARQLLFQARINLELFNHASVQLHEALDQLNLHNFSHAFGGCRMNEGIFGTDIHTAEMVSWTQRVTGFLLAAVTAGHRFLSAVNKARNKDNEPPPKK